MNEHVTTGGGLEEDEEGFVEATCVCGFRVCGLPDEETAIDILMEHAYEMGRNER